MHNARNAPAIALKFHRMPLSLKKELEAVRREYGKLQQAIYEAAQVQRRLCAPREMVWGDFEIAGESFPVRHLSGDFFKVMELGVRTGRGAGRYRGQRTVRRNLASASDGLDPALRAKLCASRRCHRGRQSRTLPGPWRAADYRAVLWPARCRTQYELVYCNAGLPAPVLMRRDKSVERLEEGGPMLGALEEATYNVGTVRMGPGDMLLAYSDGLTECRNPATRNLKWRGCRRRRKR